MTENMVEVFVSFFRDPSMLGIGLAVAFAAIWLYCYWPPLFRDGWLWAVLAGSAILTLAAIAFVQIPLQTWTNQAMGHFWSREVLVRWLLLTGIPAVLISGLVQEGAKLVPVVVCWWRRAGYMDPKLGLAIGAVAGAGFGAFEAQWVHNTIFASGWTWEAVEAGGVVALAGFWERFFTVAAHTAFSALAGYGLASDRGCPFYVVASLLHALLNYSVVLSQSGLLSTVQVEVFVAVVAVLSTGWALWLRWRRSA